jgi:peptide deformylase
MEILVPDEFKYLFVQNEERPVVKIPAPVLRQVAKEVAKPNKKTEQLIDEMLRVMKLANGIGLAAPQLGVGQRVVVIGTEGIKPFAMVNPRIVSSEGSFTGQEGCLSIPGLYGDVTRPEFVKVEALDARGKQRTFQLEGMAAKVTQHEIDHLDGVLFIDKVDLTTLHWSHPGQQDKDEAE